MKDVFVYVIVGFIVFSPTTFGRSTVRRIDAELAAIAAALENYKADHGHYPIDARTTGRLRPNSTFDPNLFMLASRFLYRALSGDADGDPSTRSPQDGKAYIHFRPEMLRFQGARRNTYIVDPWGYSYGYSTFKSVRPDDPDGNNPTFDLWSTGGGATKGERKKWIKNW